MRTQQSFRRCHHHGNGIRRVQLSTFNIIHIFSSVRVEARCSFVCIIIFIQVPSSKQIDTKHKEKRWFKRRRKRNKNKKTVAYAMLLLLYNTIQIESRKLTDCCGNQVEIAHQHHLDFCIMKKTNWRNKFSNYDG